MLDLVLDTRLQNFHLLVTCLAEEGQTTVLLGESGAGKSTVLRLLAGLLHPQRGHIVLGGVTYFDSERHIVVPAQERPFGYVFQDYALFPHLTTFENIAFGLRAQHLSRQVVRERVGRMLELVRLGGYEQRRPGQLSGGQQQRVAIARALVLQPQLLLLDEPLSALDVQTRREVRQVLRSILRDTAVTTVMVTHQYQEALLLGQSILVLDQGRVIQQGDTHDLVEQPRSSYVAELVGLNFFRGRITAYESTHVCAIQLAGAMEVLATLNEGYKEQPAIGSEAYIIVDLRSITLHSSQPEGSARNIFAGEITHILYVGTRAESSEGIARISIQLDHIDQAVAPLIAEITAASLARMDLYEGKHIYASFKATEARAYI